jgi:hypothetical protein
VDNGLCRGRRAAFVEGEHSSPSPWNKKKLFRQITGQRASCHAIFRVARISYLLVVSPESPRRRESYLLITTPQRVSSQRRPASRQARQEARRHLRLARASSSDSFAAHSSLKRLARKEGVANQHAPAIRHAELTSVAPQKVNFISDPDLASAFCKTERCLSMIFTFLLLPV